MTEMIRAETAIARRSLLIRWLFAAVALGIAWRIIHYGLNFQTHPDDAALLNNVLVKSWRELLLPLANMQVAPPLFLWIEKLQCQAIRYDYGTRIWPFIAGFASLVMMAMLCRHMLRGSVRWLALGIFSTTQTVAMLSVRAKPYSTDLLVSLVLTYLAMRYIKQPCRALLLVAMGLFAAAAMWMSYTTLFVASGIGLVLAGYLLLHRQSLPFKTAAALGLYAFVVIASLLFLYLIVIRFGIAGSQGDGLTAWWANGFPPLNNPFHLIYWLVETHTDMMYAYPIGGHHFGCAGQFILWLIGVRGMWRRGNRWPVALLLAPQAMLLVAAILRLYPYGGSPRLCLFLAPAMCIFIASGVGEISRRFHRIGRRRTIWIAGMVVLIAFICNVAWDFVELLVFRPEPTIRTLLTQVDTACGPDDCIVCLNDQRTLLGGSDPRQVFEFYMLRTFTHPIAWNGNLSGHPLLSGHKLFVILFKDGKMRDPEWRVRAWVSGTFGNTLRQLLESRSAAMHKDPGEVYIYEFSAL